MKIGEIIQRVKSKHSKGVDSDDSRLAARLIYNKLLSVRALLVSQKLGRGKSFSEWDLQPLHCIEMVKQTPVSCGSGHKCPLMKSKYPLPKAITDDMTENIVVTSHDGKISFYRTTFETYKHLMGNKYTGKLPYYYIHDDYLYLINTKMEKAHMHGIWNDPVEVYRLHMEYQGKSTCFDNKTVDFYTPLQLTEKIIEVTFLEMVEDFNKSTEDITNDSKDSLLQETR